MIDRAERRGERIEREARRWIGAPYRHQGRGADGLDCVGLLIAVGKSIGAVPMDYEPEPYGMETDGAQLRRELARWARLVRESDGGETIERWAPRMRRGDVVVFRIVGLPQHAAVATRIQYGAAAEDWGVVHAYNTAGRVVEHRLDERWASRIVQVWRLDG
jgi:hypothetical protein